MTPGDRSGSVAIAAVAVAVAFSLLLAVGAAAGAPTAGASGDGDGDDIVAGNGLSIENDTDDVTGDDSVLGTGDDSENDSTLVNGSDAGTAGDDDGSTLDDVTAGTDGETSVDADGNASADTDGTDLDSSVGLEAGNRTVLDANLSTTVGEDGIGVDIASSDAGVLAGTNASASATAGSDGDRSDDADEDDERRPAGATADGTGANGDDSGADGGDSGADGGGMSAPEQAGAGLVIGSVLVGGGLLARRFGEAATLAGSSGGSGGGAPVLSAAITWLRAWGWRLLALAGYQRLDSSDPLEHETRAAVYEAIRREPGVFLAELQERTDVPMSTLRYHLRILEFEDLIDSEKVRGKRRYVQVEADPDALDPALEDEATAAVLEAVAREPDSVSGLADRLDRDPSTVTHHLQRLDDEGLVEREREGRSVITRLADGIDRTEVAVAASAGHAD